MFLLIPQFISLEERAMKRLTGIIEMSSLGLHFWNHVGEKKYGLGRVRPASKFFETFGINAKGKYHEHHLCKFVKNGHMDNMFKKYLCANGMGIDYSKISYRFKEPV